MAIIQCPECGKSISDKAKTCPNCGVPIAAKKRENQKISARTERTIYECKTHWIAMVIPAIVGLLFLFSGIVGMTGTKNKESAVGFLIIAIIAIGFPFLRIKTNKLILTNKRIYGKTGIIRIQSLTSPIEKIQTVNIDKGLLGRVLGYADIKIHCITGVYIFKKQSNAEEMQNAILNTIK